MLTLWQNNGDNLTRILILDIETSPNLAFVWKFWKENIGAKQVLEHTTILSFACKWLGEDEVFYYDTHYQNEKELLGRLIEYLDAADFVVAHNGDKFDLPTIQGRALVVGHRPPSPYKTIDTLLVSRYEFNFPSNTLEYLADILGVEKKDNHQKFPGFELWAECLKNNPEAWEEMKAYNIQDVVTLEQVYLKMRPWMRRHPNVGVIEEDNHSSCPKCGSHALQRRGFSYTNFGKYQRYQCTDCGGWTRTRYTEMPIEKRKGLLANAA